MASSAKFQHGGEREQWRRKIHSHRGDNDYDIIQQTNKDGITEVLPNPSDLEIGTISKVTFMNVNDSEFVERVIDELRMKGIYLWTFNDNGAELLFEVLKSSTTAAGYQAMLTK